MFQYEIRWVFFDVVNQLTNARMVGKLLQQFLLLAEAVCGC
jgi:hypothetical protein